MILRPLDRLLIVGLTGSGKTYFANREILGACERAAVWTPHRNFDAGFYESVSRVPRGALKWGVAAKFDGTKTIRTEFMAFANECMTRRMPLIIVDEIVLLTQFGCEPPLVMLATQARNYGCALATISQRAYNVPITVRSQTSRLISFQQTSEHDVRVLNEMAGKGDAFFSVEKMRTLKQGQYVSAEVRSC